MKLNIDCIRDLLNVLVDNLEANESFDLTELLKFKATSKYAVDELYNALWLLCDGDYVRGVVNQSVLGDYFAELANITMKGYEFAGTLKDETTWGKTKQALTKIGSYSLEIVKEIATKIAVEIATKQS